jgi:hypothetical protein
MMIINFRALLTQRTWAYFLVSVMSLFCTLTQKSFSESLDHEGTPYKLSTGIYNITEPKMTPRAGEDVNLRASSFFGNTWLGIYQTQDKTFSQTRMGWDSSYDLGGIRVQPSLQSAAGGFLGGSVGIETGEHLFTGVGLGRTNLKNYFNLNFDPNDAWSMSAGYRWSAQKSISLQIVHDNREHPDQQHVHLVYRTPFLEGDRFLIDLLYKSGSVESQFVRKYGLMTGVDWGPLGLRLAYDPKVNFSNADMKRFIVSYRY